MFSSSLIYWPNNGPTMLFHGVLQNQHFMYKKSGMIRKDVMIVYLTAAFSSSGSLLAATCPCRRILSDRVQIGHEDHRRFPVPYRRHDHDRSRNRIQNCWLELLFPK
jgi:hypothetical protein